MSVRLFGETAEGEPVRAVRIAGGGLSAEFIEWGCVTRDLRLEGLDRSLVLGLATLRDYEAMAGGHVGAVAGRCANRISGARFVLDGREHRLEENVPGATLHSGSAGFGRALWRLEDHGAAHARFRIRQEDGAGGFPGAIEAEAEYRLEDRALLMVLTAQAGAPTLCNLAQHSYFNLSGEARIDDHRLTLAAGRLTPLGADMCPTGDVRAVSPAEDFREGRLVGARSIDVNYVLAEAPRAEPASAARLEAGRVMLEVETTAPGLQVYTADGLGPALAAPGAVPPGPRAGLCLEAQLWPDAVNRPGFPSVVLRPGEVWRQKTRLRLSARG
ncbi:MAG: aldose epimerase family protein [Pikeienuella sp.]|uniref:aldose epimerase family protein n=1 Tax=Pikeienuella sp. TaxID=2831957 RepID=UPI00391C23C1